MGWNIITYHLFTETHYCCVFPLSPLSFSLCISPPNLLYQPHGRAWKVHNKELLVEEVIPKYFGQSNFASFTRQLSGWGFKRLHKTSPDVGCYYHECFLRGHSRLTVLMRRMPSGQGRATPDAINEPDFYTIAHKLSVEKSDCVPEKDEDSYVGASVAF